MGRRPRIMAAMETAEVLRQRVQRTRQLRERVHRAAERLRAAQQERVWAIVSSHEQGLSIRQIAPATGLSAARVHQLLADHAAADIPVWLSRLREQDWPGAEASATTPPGAARRDALTEEVTALRQCLGWLEQAERGETVVVNLRPDTDAEREYVVFERWRILRVLERIAADLDDLARPPAWRRRSRRPTRTPAHASAAAWPSRHRDHAA